MAMDSKIGSRKASNDDDVDVDHYFLPGGILDTPSHEEDMIGGSLLDEIGGVGNVNLLPAKQMAVSRIMGSEARRDVPPTGVARHEPHGHRKVPGSVVGGGPTRLSVEGTNPMAKEFTPSSCSAPSDTALESMQGESTPEPPPTTHHPPPTTHHSPPTHPPPIIHPRTYPSTNQDPLGDRGQNPRHHPGTAWPSRATALPTRPGSLSSSRHQHMSATSSGRDHLREEAGGRAHRTDRGQAASKPSSRNRIPTQQSSFRREPQDPMNNSGQGTAARVPSTRQGCAEHAEQSTADSRLKPAGKCYSDGPAPALSSIRAGQEVLAKGALGRLSGRLSSPAKQDVPLAEEVSSDQGEPAFASGGISNQSSGHLMGNSGERAARQAKSSEEAGGHLQPHVSKEKEKEKEKEKAKPKKKEEKIYRPGPKVLLGTAAREPSRPRGGSRPSLSQRLRVLAGYLRSLAIGIVAAVLRTIAWQLNRLHLVGRVLSILSLIASSGVFLLSVLVMTMSWLFLLGLRVHSLALKEATGSIHVVVCFLFPYCFQYLVSLIGEWAPHWLPACLWYSFLMQMFCTSNHQYKHSMSSHLVPALRALLPVAFLCEVPSGRSYLLALSGSELLLLSFTLAAVRLRCLFSPIFLLSWSSQVPGGNEPNERLPGHLFLIAYAAAIGGLR
eukprot:jgi/Undpi1/4987/HiC_scaffold_19.g08339.m1